MIKDLDLSLKLSLMLNFDFILNKIPILIIIIIINLTWSGGVVAMTNFGFPYLLFLTQKVKLTGRVGFGRL